MRYLSHAVGRPTPQGKALFRARIFGEGRTARSRWDGAQPMAGRPRVRRKHYGETANDLRDSPSQGKTAAAHL